MARKILALIPARGGSKSIPRKNLLVLAGKPLIAHSIEQALASRHINRVIVSTDDDKIAQVARSCQAEVPFMRPSELAQDASLDIETFRFTLRALLEREGYDPDLVVHLRPTGPVRSVALIDQAIETMLQYPEADSLRSVSWPQQTPYKMWRMEESGYLVPLAVVETMPEAHSMPRQWLPETFWQNGYVDIVRPRTVLELNSMAGKKVLPFVVDEPIYELDYPEDVSRVERALASLERGSLAPHSNSGSVAKRYPV